MQRDIPDDAASGGPSAQEPDGVSPMGEVGRARSPSGEELEVAELRVAPADIGKLRQVVSAARGAVAPAGAGDASRPAGRVAVIHPMDGSGMHLVDLRSSEPGWVLGILAAFRNTQVL